MSFILAYALMFATFLVIITHGSPSRLPKNVTRIDSAGRSAILVAFATFVPEKLRNL